MPQKAVAELYRTEFTYRSDTRAPDALPKEEIICCRSFKPDG